MDDFKYKYLKYKTKYTEYLKKLENDDNSNYRSFDTNKQVNDYNDYDDIDGYTENMTSSEYPIYDTYGGKKDVYDKLDNETRKFIESLKNSKPINKLKPEEARQILNYLQADQSYKSLVDIQEYEVSYESQSISITVFKPKNSNDTLNAMIYFHGGGWVLGNSQTHGRLVSEIAAGSNIAVIFVNYTPAPEAKYPTQLNQCYLATKYICNNGANLNINTDRIILAGDSVGGNIVAAITLLAKAEDPYLAAKFGKQILMYPVTSSKMNTKSYNEYKNGFWLTKDAMQWYFKQYLTDKQNRSFINISPLEASIEQLINLPPGLIITAENDILRDEGEEYAHKLLNAGVFITSARFLGTIHDFLMLDPLKNTPAALGAKNMIIDYVKKHFGNV